MYSEELKILFVEPCPVNFGGYFRALNICQGLCHLGHKIDLLVASNKKFSFKIEKHNPSAGLTVYVLPRFYFHNLIQGRLLRATITIMFSLLRQYHIYHLAMPSAPESNIPALFLKLIGKKNIVIDWDDIYELGVFQNWTLHLKYIKFFEIYFPSIFNNYCVTSDYLGDIAHNRGAKNVIKIINGVNQDQFQQIETATAFSKLKLDTKFKYILAFGNTFDGPRGTLLFQTFNKLTTLDPSYRLLVNFEPKSIDFPLTKDVSQKIISVGFIQPSDLGYYTAVSIGFLFLSDSSPMERAGYPIRIGSSLNGSLPIFSLQNDTEVAHTISKYHCGIQAKDPTDLAQQIVNLVRHPKKYANLKNNTAKARDLLSTTTLAKKLSQFYFNILKS